MAQHGTRVGRHVSTGGGMSNAFANAIDIGCDTMQMFISSPRMWGIAGRGAEQAGLFRKNAEGSGIAPVFVHMPYLPNLASPDRDMYKKSVEALVKISGMCDELCIEYVITHLGSHKGEGKEKGIRRVIDAVSTALGGSERVKVLLEDQAGHNNSVGAEIEDIKEIFSGIGGRRVGICLDTCHMFAAGYDIRDHKVLDSIDRALGFNNTKCVHLNDSMSGLGSFKDRHERIGNGAIGIEGFKSFFSYRKARGIPVIMETAHSSSEGEAREISLVRRLIG